MQLFTLLGLNFAGIKFCGFRVLWSDPRIFTKFNPAKNRYRRIREIKSPRKVWKRGLIREIFKFIVKEDLHKKTVLETT